MKLRKPLNFGKWVFYILMDNREEMRVPSNGYAKSLNALTIMVDAAFSVLSSQGKTDYKDSAYEEAESLNLSYRDYLSKLVEHQICLRNGGMSGGLCDSSGLGDTIHEVSKKVDSFIETAPAPIRKTAQTVINKVLHTPKLGSCSRCGGTKSYTANQRNLGRAGKLNSF